MRSLTLAVWVVVMLVTSLKVDGVLLQEPTPIITPGPSITGVEALVERDDPDAISLAQILLTALPASLRIIAATNVPAVSSILWGEFLDNKRPEWFNQLPLDIQSYLIRNFGPSTAWPTAIPTVSGYTSIETTPLSTTQTISELSSKVSSPTGSISSIIVSTQSSTNPATTSTGITTAIFPEASAFNDTAGLSRNQKVGIGLGVPLAILATAAILLLFCLLLRRRRKRSINGSQPPSSPGFIPRFAFQEKEDHHTPLNRESSLRHISQDTTYSNAFDWDDTIEPMASTQFPDEKKANSPSMSTVAPVAAPSLYHTHSSNRARGKRTSYSSLLSVAELREPDESPVLPRESFRPSASRRQSSGLNPGTAQTKRKPIPPPSTILNISSLSGTNAFSQRSNLPAPAAAANILRPSISSNDNGDSIQSNISDPFSISPVPFAHSSPNIPTSPISPLSSTSSRLVNPISKDPPSRNPFLNDFYVEDYGAEYAHVFPYDDLENGLYGGHTDLSRYPEYNQVTHSRVPSTNASRTDWPLRNTLSGHHRNKSPLWDRVYCG